MLVGLSLEQNSNSSSRAQSTPADMAGYLVAIAEKRCRVSFTKLFSYFAPRLKSYALSQSNNEALAMELVQDTMSNVWQKAHLFNPEKGSPSTWIFTIARNIRFDILRKLQNRKEDICADDLWPVLVEQTADVNEQLIEDQITLEQIGELLEKLPEKQKHVIESIYIHGLSQQEVADQLKIPLGTVKSRTRLALVRLKELLEYYD